MTAPIQPGSVGELFWRVSEAVVLIRENEILAWNPSAQRLFGHAPPGGARVDETFGALLGVGYERLQPLLSEDGATVVDALETCGLVLDIKSWPIHGSDIRLLIMSDVTSGRRLATGLARMSTFGRELLVSEPALPDLLQQLVDEAKSMTDADFSALLLLRPDHPDAVSHFVYNAPRDMFPERLPRVIGLLAVPLAQRAVVLLDDIRGHPAGVGIPVKHPPIGPLLAAPVLAGDRIVGEIAVANAPGHRRFDEVDKQLLVDLAAHTGVAVRWAESREQARTEMEVRQEIIATARHDIRNPLTIGKGYASILETRRDRMTPEQVDSAIVAVRHAFERIEAFASQALIGEDETTDATAPQWAPLAVGPLLASLSADHTTAARDVGTRVVTNAEAGSPERFVGDPGMVREVLDNLVANAIKYGATGGVVTVTARGEGGHVRFDVHNDGDGIALDDQQRIFDRYWRADDVREGDIPGTGLGLAIVRRLVELHDGVVGVSSRPEEGTTFWVTFPRVAPASPPVSAPSPS